MIINIDKEYGKIILRISLALVFIYFSVNQLINPGYWTGFVPNFALQFGLSAKNLVLLNGIFEIIFGSLMLLGIYTRVSALLLSLHLTGIAISIGFSDPTGIRDFGLAMATLAIFFLGKDKFCLGNKFNNDL
ncbi:MAG: DoxX family membrane protein [Nanoarchaeota archaeon]